jgi:predicted permease
MKADVIRAFRQAVQNPGFTAVAVLILALGIGANSSIFTLADALLLRSLPYENPDRLALVSAPPASQSDDAGWVSYPLFRVLNERAHSFSGLAACIFESFSLTGHGDPQQIQAARTTWNFFDVLGVRPVVGRTFSPDEDRPGGAPVVMISYQLWTRLFARDPAVAGRTLSLESRPYSIIGVLPAGFEFSLLGPKVDVWAPRVSEMSLVTPARVAAGGRYFQVIGRLAPGISREQARAEIQALYVQYKRENSGNFDAPLDLSARVADLKERMVANVRPGIVMLSSVAGVVLLIACANVASLLLALAVGRRKEFAVRVALGATRSALIRQLLSESVLLGLMGGMCGVALGFAGTRFLAAYGQATLPGSSGIAINTQVLLFTLTVSIGAGVLFGLAPSVQLSKPDLNSMLREEGRGSAGNRRGNRARGFLVIAQVALSTVLLIGSGLLIRSFVNLRSITPGFEPKHLLTMQVSLRKYTVEQSMAFYKAVILGVDTLPGVTASAISTALPPTATHATPVLFEGYPNVALGKRPIINLQQTSPDYPEAMGVPIVSGRSFTNHDDARAPRVGMLNVAAVRRFWPAQNPIGKHVWVGNLTAPVEIVGVLGDVRNSGLAVPPAPELFLPFEQLPWSFLCLSVRGNGDPHGLISAVRREIAKVDPDQPVTEIHTGEELLEGSQQQTRFMLFLLGGFSAIAFVLAVTGIYGLIAYTVAQRTQELQIRVALGAAKRDILRLVVSNGLLLAGCGILIGLAGSLAVTRLLRAMLYEVSVTDPLTFLATALVFIAAAALASYVPAVRALSVDLSGALRFG